MLRQRARDQVAGSLGAHRIPRQPELRAGDAGDRQVVGDALPYPLGHGFAQLHEENADVRVEEPGHGLSTSTSCNVTRIGRSGRPRHGPVRGAASPRGQARLRTGSMITASPSRRKVTRRRGIGTPLAAAAPVPPVLEELGPCDRSFGSHDLVPIYIEGRVVVSGDLALDVSKTGPSMPGKVPVRVVGDSSGALWRRQVSVFLDFVDRPGSCRGGRRGFELDGGSNRKPVHERSASSVRCCGCWLLAAPNQRSAQVMLWTATCR
jgi:hypothetical protein